MVVSAERERLKHAREKEKAEREAEKERIRAAKEAARAEKELKRRQEVAEREQRRKEREALEAEKELKKREKEARRHQEEAKKLQVEAEREQRRREKEAVEAEKEHKRKERELKRQQDEAEKEQKRKEKEAAERKKQLLLQKQANIMDRLFRRKDSDTSPPQEKLCSPDSVSLQSPVQQNSDSSPIFRSQPSTSDVMLRVDWEMKTSCNKSEDEVLRNHVVSWQEKWKSRSSEPFRRWGIRMTPKMTVFRELRLQGAGMGSARKIDSADNTGNCSISEAQAPSLKRSRQEDGRLDDCKVDDNVILLNDDLDTISSPPRKKHCGSRWKLLQFDKSHRPAYYGTFSKLSSTIRPRRPLTKDPSLDYEVDSDEEWEEEDPGESLSDCEDKEDEIEKVEPELDEDAADGFVVPDGYLSENEGVHLEEADTEDTCKVTVSQSLNESGMPCEISVSMDQLVRKHQHLMKLLDNVTKHALQRNRPFLVSDLLQRPDEKGANVENQTERLCFQALRMCIVAPTVIMPPAFIMPPAIEA